MPQPFYAGNPTYQSVDLPFNSSESMLTMHFRKTGPISLPVADLMFLQATGNYCWLHWRNGQRLLLPRTLKYYEPQLPDALFVRPHHNCIVNIQYIERMERIYPDKGGIIHLRSGVALPISRRRWLAIRQLYTRLKTDH